MAELQVHQGESHSHVHTHAESDPVGARVGMMVGVLGVLLAVVTIAAHREHTAAVIHRTESNDQWAFYQAKKSREYVSDVASQLLQVLGTDSAKMEPVLKKLTAAQEKYTAEAKEIKAHAEEKDVESQRAEQFAARYDIGEGLLELGLVLTSLYFLGRQRFLPIVGGLSAFAGMLVAISPWISWLG